MTKVTPKTGKITINKKKKLIIPPPDKEVFQCLAGHHCWHHSPGSTAGNFSYIYYICIHTTAGNFSYICYIYILLHTTIYYCWYLYIVLCLSANDNPSKWADKSTLTHILHKRY